MSPDEEALDQTLGILEKVGIPYMLAGSLASSYHGRPRATHDADIVIDPTAQQLEALVHDLDAAEFYVDRDRARRALQERGQFNVIETQNASKIDLIIRKERPFSHQEFARRQQVGFASRPTVSMVTAEDAILSKLEWARRSGDSERQLRDAAGVLEINPRLDRAYIERWAIELGVSDLWRTISGG